MVAFDAVGPGSSGTQSATSPLTWSHTCGASANKLLVGISVDAASNDSGITAAVTYNGVSMSSVRRWESGGSGHTVGFVQVFSLDNPPTGSALTVSVTLTGSGFDGITGGSISLTGAGTNGSAVTADSAGASATSGTISVPTTSSSSLVVVFVTNGSDTTAFTAGTSRFVNNTGIGFSGGASFSAGATAPGTGSNVSVSWTQGADFYAAVGLEVQPGAPVTPLPPPAQTMPPGRFSPMAFPTISIPPPQAPPPVITSSASLSGSGTLSNSSTGLGIAMSGQGSLSAVPPTIVGLAGGGTGYFVDQFGKPRLVWGDAAWAWPGNAGRWNSGNWQADFDTFLSNRQAQGFTVIYCKPIGTTQSSNIDDNGVTFDGLYPFQGGNPSTGTAHAVPSSGLTSAFWARIDYMLNSALSKGITIFFNATGYGTDWEASTSWGGALNNTEAQAYGAALGARYANQLNIVWNIEDDYFGTADSKLNSFLTGLRGAGDTHLVAIENMPESSSRFTLDSTPATCAWGNSNAQYNFVYSYNQEYYGIEQTYAEASPIPVIQGDGYFYQGGNAYFATYDRSFRQAAWWSLTSGARGKVNGSESIWQYNSTALANSATDWFYAHNSLNIRTVVESLPNWYMLLPDTASAFVTGGRGTRASPFTSGGGGGQYNPAFTSSYVSASITVAGDLAMAYLPNSTTITIDQSKLVAGYVAYWVDPFTGAMTSATTGSTYNSTAKGNNSQGDPDWVLVFMAQSAVAGSASLSGQGSLTAGSRFEESASLAGIGSLTASPRFEESATLSGSGALGVTPRFESAVTMSGQGTLAATSRFEGSAPFSGQGTLVTNPRLEASAVMSGSGSLFLQLGLATSLSGQGTLAVSPRFEGSAILSGQGSLTASPRLESSAALSGQGTLTPSPVLASSAAMSGQGTLAALPRFEGAAALSGQGTLFLALSLQVTLSGTGTITAIAGGFPASSSMFGQGSLSVSSQLLELAALTGQGTLSADSQLPSAAAMSGSGILTAASQIAVAVALSGTGSVAFSGTLPASVTMAGSGILQAVAAGLIQAAASFSGQGSLSALGGSTVQRSASLSGSGTLGASTANVGFHSTVIAVDFLAYTVAAADYLAYTVAALDRKVATVIAAD